jgi:hypothetical protein
VRKSLKDLAVEYGKVGLVIYLTSTVMVYVGFWFAREFVWAPETVSGNTGFWLAAYAFAKLSQIPRIAGTAAITPFVARFYERMLKRKREPSP